MKTVIAVLNKNGENSIPILLTALEIIYPKNGKSFGLATSSKIFTGTSVGDLETRGTSAQVAVGYAYSGIAPKFDLPNLSVGKNATVTFDGRIYSTKPKSSASKVSEKKLPYPDTAEAVASFLKDVEGDFSLIAAQASNLIAVRDAVGVQPLYFGENEKLCAIASNRKALWNLGIEKTKSFPPGHLGVVSHEGFKFSPIETLTFSEPKSISMSDAAKMLQELLEYSVKIRVFGQKKVAVAFSGGLDSSLVAQLAKNAGTDVQLFHVSLKGQPETDEAREAAKMLDLPLKVHLFTEADLENVVPKVIDLIEESDPTKVGVGVPFYWNAQKASEAGYRVLLAGQGADELFGGYLRYVTEYIRDGEEKVRRTMFKDVVEIFESNLERDEKIFNFHDVELRLPFASYRVVKFAMSLPTELKFENSRNSLRKLVLRKTAENLNIPTEIVNKPKKAVQYSTGVNDALKKLSKRQNLTFSEYLNRIFLETKKS